MIFIILWGSSTWNKYPAQGYINFSPNVFFMTHAYGFISIHHTEKSIRLFRNPFQHEWGLMATTLKWECGVFGLPDMAYKWVDLFLLPLGAASSAPGSCNGGATWLPFMDRLSLIYHLFAIIAFSYLSLVFNTAPNNTTVLFSSCLTSV